MTNLKVLPTPYREYTEPDMTFDCINSGLDPIVGTAGLIDSVTNASEISSFQRASYETHKIWYKELDEHICSYNNNGEIVFEFTKDKWNEYNPTGATEWKDCISPRTWLYLEIPYQ